MFHAIREFFAFLFHERIDCPNCGGESPKSGEDGRVTFYECKCCRKVTRIKTLD